jgi:hypothetical protein
MRGYGVMVTVMRGVYCLLWIGRLCVSPWPYGPKPYARMLVLAKGVARAIARGHMECIRPCKRGAPSLGGAKSPF